MILRISALAFVLSCSSTAMAAGDMMGGPGRAPPAKAKVTKEPKTTDHEEASDTVLAEGVVVLAPILAKAAAGLREVDLEVYLPGSTSKTPYGWTKVFIKKDAVSEVTPFTIYDGKLNIAGEAQPLKVFDIKAKLISTGLIGLDGAGDLTGIVKGVKSGSQSVQIMIDTAH